jgi:hypothetical protein
MPDDRTNDLSPAERHAFEALPREITPRPDLEERIVAALQSRGVLPTPISVAPSHRRNAPARKFWIPVAAAAALSIFTTGLVVGQYLGSRTTALAFMQGSASASEAAERVERAGNRYIQAMAALGAVESVNPAQRDSARAVALRVLTQAAEEMALLAPDDPLAAAVLRVQGQRGRQQNPEAASRSVVWY